YFAPGETIPDSLPLLFVVTARDGAGNETVSPVRPVNLVGNLPPTVTAIQILDSRGFALSDDLKEITSGREIVVAVTADDHEGGGIGKISLSLGQGPIVSNLTYQTHSTDSTAPFQFHIQVPAGHVGEFISFRATATDVDGNTSELSAPRTLTIVADKPPSANIIKPANNNTVIIDGQDLEILVETLDDMGAEGIDRVSFLVNDKLVYTTYTSEAAAKGTTGQDHIYRAAITPPEKVDGFAIQAIAYDRLGQQGKSQVVHVGRIDDTVVPKLSVLQPVNKDILSIGETFIAAVSIRDIGAESGREVTAKFIREAQTATGEWVTVEEPGTTGLEKVESVVTLYRNDAGHGRPAFLPVSDPDNHYYVYWAPFNHKVIKRSGARNVRVKVEFRVKTSAVTPEPIVQYYEVGMPVSERRFLKPADNTISKLAAKEVYYGAVAQFKDSERTGAMVGAWSTIDPTMVEQGLGLDYPINAAGSGPVCSGIVLAAFGAATSASGDVFVY